MFLIGATIVSLASALLPTGYIYYLHAQPMLNVPNVMLGLALMVRGGERVNSTDIHSESSQPSPSLSPSLSPSQASSGARANSGHGQPVPRSFQFNVGTLHDGPDAIRTMETTNQIVKEFAACPAATGEGEGCEGGLG